MAGGNIPVTIIAGYLGAGKTTLLNAMLRSAGDRRLAVMVNDFGSINIDAELIIGAGDAVNGIVELANGCICCSMGNDLGFTLLDLLDRRPAPEHIIIEASGIAEPGRVRGFLGMLPGLRVEATLVVADATRIVPLAGDNQIGPLIDTQLKAADLLLISKTDLTNQAELARTRQWLRQSYPGAHIIEVCEGQLPVDVLLGPGGKDPQKNHRHGEGWEARFTSFSFETECAFERDRLTAVLNSAPKGLLRAKGFLRFADAPETIQILQLVGPRWSLTDPGALPAGKKTRLVLIGLADELKQEEIRNRLVEALVSTTALV